MSKIKKLLLALPLTFLLGGCIFSIGNHQQKDAPEDEQKISIILDGSASLHV